VVLLRRFERGGIGRDIAATIRPGDIRADRQAWVRAPHMWIERDQEQLSTLDLWNGRWALIGGPRSDGWQKAAASAGIPTVMWGRDVIVDVSQFLELYGLADDGAVLVRPDGHVAWRSAAASENPEHQLAAVLAAVPHTTTTKDLT
jgi:hypothetical protein